MSQLLRDPVALYVAALVLALAAWLIYSFFSNNRGQSEHNALVHRDWDEWHRRNDNRHTERQQSPSQVKRLHELNRNK